MTTHSHSPPRILVVEDDADLRHIYSEGLRHSGYKVDTAEDGEAGWHALQAAGRYPEGYDLLITDNNMPNLTGVGLIQKLRSADLDLPVMLVSGNIPTNTDSLHLAAILPKPFTLGQLLLRVDGILHWSTVMVNRCGNQFANFSESSVTT